MSAPPLALRVKPRPGSLASYRGPIEINCLRIERLPQKTFWHYDAFQDPDVRAATKWIIFDNLKHQNPQIFSPLVLYDGNKNIYSLTKLEFPSGDPGTFTVPLQYPRKEYTLIIKLVNVIQPLALQSTTSETGNSDQRLVGVNLTNVLVRSHAVATAGISVKGRGFYSSVGRLTERPGVLEFWRGTISSVRPAIGRYLINLDTSVLPMYPEGSPLDALMALHRMRSPHDLHAIVAPGHSSRRLKADTRKFLKGLKVRMKHQGGKIVKKISDVEWESADRYEFDMQGEMMTVKEYFMQKNIRLSFPTLPIMAKIGKTAVLPLELLSIEPGQPYRGVVPEHLAPSFLRFSTQRPQQRMSNLRSSLEALGLDYLQNPPRHRSTYLHQAGMKVENQFMRVDARVLPPPSLQAKGGTQIKSDAKAGSWNMLRHQVCHPVEVRYLALILAAPAPPGFDSAVGEMIRIWNEMGINTPQRTQWVIHQVNDYNSLKRFLATGIGDGIRGKVGTPKLCIRKGVEYRGTALVVIFVPDSAKAIREGSKYWGDVITGYATQVLKVSKLTGRGLDQYARNVGLKVNAKMSYLRTEATPKGEKISIMSGVNVEVPDLNPDIVRNNTMIVGLDTSHPLSGSEFPTLAAMVFSIDSNLTQYRGRVAFQRPRQELISNLEAWIEEAMTAHASVPKDQKPYYAKRVIVYRDGVSEGQFQQVLQIEVKAIIAALAKIAEARNLPAPPQLTFIVVGKKHHIRFFPRPGSGMADRNDNAVPGTVVDTDITTPEANLFDFYLQSHGSLLGTSRPAHYSVLYDDSGFSADHLEKFSHDLCHVYQIATRSVSIPAPVYYADKLAGRSSIFFHDINNRLDQASRVSDEMTFDDWEQEIRNANLTPHPQALQRMFWL